ncbi:MAG: HisA/HisF-related TIM barrel protein [Methanoregula sp.]|jgi:phosphoribosylformimino-5-aminoimidazole carboxamide ribotide isomerase
MKLVLAMDLRQNLVVHGKSGKRETYKPLDWGISPTAEPLRYLAAIRPKYLYIADLDRIEGTGSHDACVKQCAEKISCCYVDRGCSTPEDMLTGMNIKNIIGTETGGANLSQYRDGFLSIDVKGGRVIPSGKTPEEFLTSAKGWNFEGCIILNIGSVGTESGMDAQELARQRAAYDGRLFYGGGVATVSDLETLNAAGFDGAIMATALHRGQIPIEWIRRGSCC